MAKSDKELTVDDKFDLLIGVLQSTLAANQQLTPDTLKEILATNASNFQKAMKPENDTHPGRSAFSHPDGDVKHPKPALPFEVFYNAYPVHKFPETETWREWELYSQVKPGEFTVIRKDASVMNVTVHGEKDATGKLTKIRIEHPILREEKNLVPPKTVLLWQLINPQNPRKAFLEAMQEHIRTLFGPEVDAAELSAV